MRASPATWCLFAATVAVFSAASAWNGHRISVQEKALSAEEHRRAELGRLLERNRLLRSEQLAGDEHNQLNEAHARAQALRERLIALQRASAPAPVAEAGRGELAARNWRIEGNATPRAALVSVLWAASRGDVDQLASLLGFSPEVRTQAEAMFGRLPAAAQLEYGGPEKVVATLLSGSFPRDAATASIVESDESGDEASIDLRVGRADGQSRTNTFGLDHGANGWHLLVPASVLSGYEKILQGEPPAPETADP
jgi:hypothetical protein